VLLNLRQDVLGSAAGVCLKPHYDRPTGERDRVGGLEGTFTSFTDETHFYKYPFFLVA